MMGHGYTGGKYMPDIIIKEKFAWLPLLTKSGKWIWRQKYVKLEKRWWGLAGERAAVEAEYYTRNEWLLEEIKHSESMRPMRPPPPTPIKKISY
jgi:hypothetical protein